MSRPHQLSYPLPPMPAVILHPGVSTKIQVFDFPATGNCTRLYESGQVLAFSSINLGMSEDDWKLIAAIEAKPALDNWTKKAKLPALLAPLIEGVSHVLDHHFHNNRVGAVLLQGLIQRVTDRLRHVIKEMFPGYRIKGESITWRLTPTESETMHYDSYGNGDDPNHHVRLFVNLDDRPRVWGVGPPVDEIITTYKDRVQEFADRNANQFNGALSKCLPWFEIARHYVAFAPGNAWLVNSQLIAHEIIYGRKMIACTFDVDPADMCIPHMFLSRVVEKALKEAL